MRKNVLYKLSLAWLGLGRFLDVDNSIRRKHGEEQLNASRRNVAAFREAVSQSRAALPGLRK